ncbi:MAG: serine protease, partial [Gemmataceae bacterium]|nr:serine protease [Gemmataceae bacterium]MDW8265808.1 trypsin-like peptidase domain-containing protein [Gemmataceae bacterium]
MVVGLGPLLWLAAGPLHSGPADAFPPRLYDQTLAGTCWVVVGEGESPRTGTGWLVDQSRRLVVTNQHVVGDAKAAVVLFPLFHQGQPVTGRVFYTRNRPHMIHALLLDSDERRDLAIL